MPRHKQFYRILISSDNAISGNANNGIYSISCTPHLAERTDKYYQIAVESFASSGINGNSPIVMNLRNLTQVNSYSTLTQGSSFAVMVTSWDSVSNNITHSSVGHLLPDITFLTNNQFNIQFTDGTGQQLTDMENWVATFVIWESDN